MDKFNRKYLFSVQPPPANFVQAPGQGSLIQVQRPFTIEFDISQSTLGASRESTFKIYNLSETRRSQIRKDQTDYSFYRKVIFDAGYGEIVPNVFTGNLHQAWSVRQGVDFITTAIAQGFGYAAVNAKIDLVFRRGEKTQDVIQAMVDSLKPLGVDVGTIGTYSGTLLRGNTFTGNTIDILNSLTGGGFFVYNGKSYCLGDNEAFSGQLTEISAETGLIGTPVRENTYLYLDLIFEPRLMVGQWVTLKSITGDGVDNVWKVISLKHRGTISEAICGTAITTVGLTSGSGAINKI